MGGFSDCPVSAPIRFKYSCLASFRHLFLSPEAGAHSKCKAFPDMVNIRTKCAFWTLSCWRSRSLIVCLVECTVWKFENHCVHANVQIWLEVRCYILGFCAFFSSCPNPGFSSFLLPGLGVTYPEQHSLPPSCVKFTKEQKDGRITKEIIFSVD